MKFSEYIDKNKYSIFVDMDGVLVDFVSGYLELTDISKQEMDDLDDSDPESFWEPISKAGFDWWATLDWMPDGKDLWNFIEPYNPTILSAPTKIKTKTCILGKKIWIWREIGNIPMIFEKDKYKYADDNHILIDDTENKISDWVAQGGIGILHTSAKDTIEKLKNILK